MPAFAQVGFGDVSGGGVFATAWSRDEVSWFRVRLENLFELKNARRVLVAGNVFENNQQGGGGFGAGIGGNVFINNSCDNQFLSGVVSFVNSSSPRVVNNVFGRRSRTPTGGIARKRAR